MSLTQSVTVGKRVIDLYTFQGEVVDEKIWATTDVSGGGGGGNVSVAPIISTTTTHNQFFLRDKNGGEKAFETAVAGVALRKGHNATTIWGIEKGNERGPIVAIYNHTTRDLTLIQSAIRELAVPPAKLGGCLLVLLVFAGAIAIFWASSLAFIALQMWSPFTLSISAAAGVLLLIVSGLFNKRRVKKLVFTLHSAIDDVISQVKNQK